MEAGYVESRAVLAGLSFETRWRMTVAGTSAFRAYVAEIQAMLASVERVIPPVDPDPDPHPHPEAS